MTSLGAQQELLSKLALADVEFVVIGGHAVAAHGFPRGTKDVDIVFSTDLKSCERMAATLRALNASIATADVPPPGGKITAEWLSQGGHFVFMTNNGFLDVLSWIAGSDYGDLALRAEPAELPDGTPVLVCGYDDLRRMKQLADRPLDQHDLAQLEQAHRTPDDEG